MQARLHDVRVKDETTQKAENSLRQLTEKDAAPGPLARLKSAKATDIKDVKQEVEEVSTPIFRVSYAHKQMQILKSGTIQWGVPSVFRQWQGSFPPNLPTGSRCGFVLLSDRAYLPWGGYGERGSIYTWSGEMDWETKDGGYIMTFTY